MHGEKGVVVGDFGKDIRYVVPIGIEVSLISQSVRSFVCQLSP